MKIKRLMDIVLSLAGLILLSPLFLLLIVLIKLDSKGPVLFKQKRVGLHKKCIECWGWNYPEYKESLI